MMKRNAAATAAVAPRDPGPVRLLPGPRALFDWRGPYLVPLVLLVLTRVAAWRLLPFAAEDAYITFRYARDLANGFGLVYNPAERVFGFSSPPWTLWTALGAALMHDPVPWARATSLLADGLTLVLAGRMLERDAGDPDRTGRASAWCFTLFFALWPYFSVLAASGMESSAMLALLALGAALARRRHPATGPALALLALWRPEGLAAALVLALGARWRDRAAAAALLLAGLAALAVYFGSPVPQSVLAKAGVYGTPGPWAGRFWWAWALPLRLPGLVAGGEARHLAALSVLLAPAAAVGAVALWRRRQGALALAAGAALAVWAGYSLLGVAYFYWYLAAPLFAAALLAAVGLPRIVRGRAVYIAVALLVASTWFEAAPFYVGRAQNEYFGFAAVGNWLRERAQPGESVLLEPIGIVGWLAPLRIVDEVGLVSPAVATRRRAGAGWYTDVAARAHPDWIVIRRGVLGGTAAFAGAGAPFRSAAERDSLFAGYVRMAALDEAASGDNALVILRRR
jgi:arabinofuranosyltransferase